MSVDRTACLGLGWVISHDEYEQMRQLAGDRWEEVEDNFQYINSYYSDSDVFVGGTMCHIDEGSYLDLGEIANKINLEFDHEAFMEDFTKILRICGQEITIDSKWAMAQIYILSLLW